MTMLSVTEAAEAAGVSRTTIYERVRAGELSKSADGIDTAELLRVFGSLVSTGTDDTAPVTDVTAAVDAAAAATHVAWLRELVDRQAKIIERQAEDLREADARAERREDTWMRQLDRLTALLPAPTPVEPEPARGLWHRLFG